MFYCLQLLDLWWRGVKGSYFLFDRATPTRTLRIPVYRDVIAIILFVFFRKINLPKLKGKNQ